MSKIEIILVVALASLWVWFFVMNIRLLNKIVEQRNEAMDEAEHWKGKYADIVTLTFMLKQSYAEQCDIEETQETALMKHAALCELLFRAGLAGTGVNHGDEAEN